MVLTDRDNVVLWYFCRSRIVVVCVLCIRFLQETVDLLITHRNEPPVSITKIRCLLLCVCVYLNPVDIYIVHLYM